MFLTQSLHPLSFWYSETSIGLTLHSAQYGTHLLGMKKKITDTMIDAPTTAPVKMKGNYF